MEEKPKYKHIPTGIEVGELHFKGAEHYYYDCNSNAYQRVIVEKGQDWVKVEPERIKVLGGSMSIGTGGVYPSYSTIRKSDGNHWTDKEKTAIESLLNEEKESTWSSEEIEAIKNLYDEWCKSKGFKLKEFLDSKKGEPKQ